MREDGKDESLRQSASKALLRHGGEVLSQATDG